MVDTVALKRGAGHTGKFAIERNGPGNMTSDQPLDSADVPPMVRADFRLPAALKERGQAEAERQGLDFSEYVRQCIVAQLAWVTAIQAVSGREGMGSLASTDWLLSSLHDLAES